MKTATLYLLTLIVGFALVVTATVFVPAVVEAQSSLCEGATGTPTPDGGCAPAGDDREVFDTDGDGDSVFTDIADTLLFITGALSVLMLIIGGIRYVISAGDAQAVTNAKNTILYAVVGLIITFLAFAAVRFVVDSLL